MAQQKRKAAPSSGRSHPPKAAAQEPASGASPKHPELVIITGLSGSGKGSVLKVFEDMGYYAVDNLPIDLIPTFGELCRRSPEISRAALVVDIREGEALRRFPKIFRELRQQRGVLLLFLQATEKTLLRRFSETRRPHPMGGDSTVRENIRKERVALRRIRALADLTIDTSKFNIHDLRRWIISRFGDAVDEPVLLLTVLSFGFKHGVPSDSDLVFDVRFLPNPNYVPQYKNLTGKDPGVVRYIHSFAQTGEFIARVSDLLMFLIPHYGREGKSYLTISFGCTGGRHRSVMIAEAVARNLASAGFAAKVSHRDMTRDV